MYKLTASINITTRFPQNHVVIRSSDELFDEYGFELVEKSNGKYHAVVVAVNHQEYVGLSEDDFRGLMSENGLLVDVKGIYRNRIKKLNYWTL